MPMPMEEQLKGGRERGGDENHDDVRECEETSHLHAVRRLLLQCAALPPPARDAEPVEVAVPPPSVSWGSLLNDARSNLQMWWLVVFPGVAIFLTVLSYNLVGEGLQEATDPRLREARK